LLESRVNYFGNEWACINPVAPLRIQGAGRDQTVLTVAPGIFANAIGCRDVDFVEVADLTINGNRVNNADQGVDGNQACIYVGVTPGFTNDLHLFENLKLINAPREGLYVGAVSSYSYVRNIYAENNGLNGIILDDVKSATLVHPVLRRNNLLLDVSRAGLNITTNALHDFRVLVLGGTYYDNGYAGIRIDHARHVTLVEPYVARSGVTDVFGGIGVYVTNSEEIDIFSPRVVENALDGILVDSGTNNVHVFGGTAKNNRFGGGVGTVAGFHTYGSYCVVEGLKAYDDQGPKTQHYGVYEEAPGDCNTFRDNDLRNNLTGSLSVVGGATVVKNNRGYSPLGVVVNPYRVAAGPLLDVAAVQAFPTSAVNYTVGHSPKLVTIYGGTVTSISVDGTVTGLTSGAFRLEAGQVFNVVWTVQPSSLVVAQ